MEFSKQLVLNFEVSSVYDFTDNKRLYIMLYNYTQLLTLAAS